MDLPSRPDAQPCHRGADEAFASPPQRGPPSLPRSGPLACSPDGVPAAQAWRRGSLVPGWRPLWRAAGSCSAHWAGAQPVRGHMYKPSVKQYWYQRCGMAPAPRPGPRPLAAARGPRAHTHTCYTCHVREQQSLSSIVTLDR